MPGCLGDCTPDNKCLNDDCISYDCSVDLEDGTVPTASPAFARGLAAKTARARGPSASNTVRLKMWKALQDALNTSLAFSRT